MPDNSNFGAPINPFALNPDKVWVNPSTDSAPTTEAKNELLKDLPVSENKAGHDKVDSEITAAIAALKAESGEVVTTEPASDNTLVKSNIPRSGLSMREKILAKHNGKVSDIPINSPYWKLNKVRKE